VKELLRRHTRRPIGARVTLTRQNLEVREIYRHLKEELGFWEVGFAPVTTRWQRDYAIAAEGFEYMLAQFQALAQDYLETSLAGRHHGFSNVRDTLEEIHKGVAKAYPCGAGLGLLGVATDGDVALCHRFEGSTIACRTTISSGTTSTTRPTVAPAGRARCARVAAITRRTRATAPRRSPTCTTVTGSAGGVRRASRCMPPLRRGVPTSCASSMPDRPHRHLPGGGACAT
jgi:hypothetical protein